ncbi:hypothetical protein B7463_g6596, partial [Scytalidium lignicola]
MSSRLSHISSAVLALAAAAVGARAATEPCAEIAKLAANDTHIFSSEIGLACLESMPFKSDLAVKFVDEYTKYAQWQSTIEILRNPPAGYLSPATDIQGGLATIRSRAAAKQYKSQYDFDIDLYNLINTANDGHFALFPCSPTTINFGLQTSLVSVSSDGVAIPELYTLEDGVALSHGAKDVSPVILINGIGAEAYVEQLSSSQLFQDPDARYNQMLANVPIDGQGQTQSGSFTSFIAFPGVHSFELTFANGTQIQLPLLAGASAALGNFTFTTGEELWQAACAPQPAAPATPSTLTTPLSAPENYPKPIVRDSFNLLVGYFPTDAGLEDVAVLSVPTFLTEGAMLDGNLPADATANFAIEAQTFVNNATAEGKKKIIIDITGNGGGLVDSGFALISIFFPNMTIFSATRIRSTEATQFVLRTFNAQNNSDNDDVLSSGFYLPDLVLPDQKTGFSTLNQFIGPFDVLGVPSTAIVAEDTFALNDPTSDPINIDGLGGKLDGTKPPFAPEDIIILTDGRCSSTCTIFINHMAPRGVRVVAVGGRPQPGPMQSIGGVKGAQELGLSDISSSYDLAYELIAKASKAGTPIYTDAELAEYNKSVPVPLADMPFNLQQASVNFRNAFSPDNDQVPTQFIYQAADCRLFYTAGSLGKPELTWASVANAMWGKGKCAFRKPTTTKTYTSTASSSKSSPSSTSGSKSGSKSGSAHKALGLLLALAEGMNPN